MILGGNMAASFDDLTFGELAALPLELAGVDVDTLSSSELHQLILHSEAIARQAKADLYQLCAAARKRNRASTGPHRNETLWLADSLRMAKGTAGSILLRGALLFDRYPTLGEAFRAGQIGDHHLDLFLRIFNKPALRPFLTRDLDALLGFTRQGWYDCRALFISWEVLVDPIDPNEYAERAYANRALAATGPVQQQVLMEILTTTAVYASIEPALNALVEELFEADWAEARARVGDTAGMDDLLRTDSQRRHDAFFRLVRQGIGADPVTANIVAAVTVDHQTLTDEAQRRDNDTTPTPDTGTDPGTGGQSGNTTGDTAKSMSDPDQEFTSDEITRRATARRCETATGRQISPADALDFALAGRVQLFVMNTATRGFERSERRRLFDRDQRLGALIRDRHCQSPGCDTAAVHCQADHDRRHTDGGKTVPTNLVTRCAPCHRHKTRLENLGLWPPTP